MSAPTCPMASAAEQAAAALAAAEQRGAKAAVAHLRSVIARAEAAEQRAEALAAEVARLRAVIAEEVTELPVWPDGAYQTPAERAVIAAWLRAHADESPSGLWDAYALRLMAADVEAGVEPSRRIEPLPSGR